MIPAHTRDQAFVLFDCPRLFEDVLVVDPDDGRPTRTGYRREKVEKRRPDGSTYDAERSVRISRRSGKDI